MPVCDDILLKSEIIIMEDSLPVQQAIRKVMEGELKWHVKIVNSGEEAVSLAEKQQAGYYILDVHMGKDREQEGLNTLEEIKQINDKAFVSIFSAYPINRRLAESLDADVFVEKTPNLQDDILHKLTSKMLEYRLKYLRDLEEETIRQLRRLNRDPNLKQHPNPDPNLKKLINPDPNLKAYDELKSDQEWLKEYQGKYVAFVDGEFVESADNEKEGQNLLEHLMKAPEYHKKPKFFTRVQKERLIIDEPISLGFDDFEY